MEEIVSIQKCTEYNYDDVKKSLLKSIEDLGGLEKYINKTDKVLLKINMLMKKTPEEATTTHPVFVEAIANILIEYGAKVIIGDSPAGPFTKKALESMYKVIGMTDVAKNTGCELNYNIEHYTVEKSENLILKNLTLTSMVKDVDKVISLSKFKTHGMMTFTGAVKNLYGTVPGALKAKYHLELADYNEFGELLVDICSTINPILSFMDGIVGMEGAGPSAGDPRNINVILASNSPYHLDKVACSIINLDFNKVPSIQASVKGKFCTNDLLDVNFKGDNIEEFKIYDFKMPESVLLNPWTTKLPNFLNELIIEGVKTKPVVNKDLCIGCKICAEACPAKIISINKNKKAEIKTKECIRCFCCQEVCPKKAIEVHKPFLAKLFESI